MLLFNIANQTVKKYLYNLLKFITFICTINSILLFAFDGKNFYLYTMIFPFGFCFIILILMAFLSVLNFRNFRKDGASQYIEKANAGFMEAYASMGKILT